MSRGAVAGDALLHPVALASLALLIFNDHVLKFRAPGLLSGKLSDVAILVVGPLLLQGIVEVFLARSGRPWGPSGRAALVACAVTGIAFALEKTLSPATELYRVTWGAMRWPLDALVAFARGLHAPARVPVAAVTDPTDLVTLPALLAVWWVHRARVASRSPRRASRGVVFDAPDEPQEPVENGVRMRRTTGDVEIDGQH